SRRVKRPRFLEGEAGVGKSALGGAVAAALDTDLIRLQCYEGLDVPHALYEWDYARQLLELRILDATHTLDPANARRELYSEPFLIKRPRSEEHTSELQSPDHLVCRLLLEKKK